MNYDKTTQILIVFIIIHKNTIRLSCVHEKFSRRLRVTFKRFVFYFEPKWLPGGFAIKTQLMFSFFRLGLFYNEVLLIL
jgi:hypothetical protein